MPIGSVSFNYTLNNHSIEKKFDTRINVKDEIEFLRLGSRYANQSLGVSYISSPKINTKKNILIIDKSNVISRNSKESIEEEEFRVDDIIIDYAGFHITDVVKNTDGVDTPLYYWHDLSHVQNISNIELLNEDKLPVSKTLWSYYDESATIGYSKKGIYTNLICNIKEEVYEIYYVRYKNLDNQLVIESLLDSRIFYQQASYSSSSEKREYTITQVGNSYSVKVGFDSYNKSPTPSTDSQRFWFKRRKQSKISVEAPALGGMQDRWNFKITPGDFFYNGKKYWVPEYYTQLFNPAFPYRVIKEQKATRINSSLFHLDINPISNLGIQEFYFYIVVKKEDGAITHAFTDDPDSDTYITKQGFVSDIFYEKNAIKSVSSNSGFFQLDRDIEEGSNVYASYRYVERYYSYDDLSVNPNINPDILGKKIIFYMVPNASSRGVHHLVIDNDDSILESSETQGYTNFNGIAAGGSQNTLSDPNLSESDFYSGYEIELLSGPNSGFKTKISGYNSLLKTLSLTNSAGQDIEKETVYRIIKKVSSYNSSGYFYGGWESLAQGRFYLIIAEAFILQTLSIPDIELLDTRILGGGIAKEQIGSAIKLQNESEWYWDLGNWDGKAYPGMGTIVVNLPRYILKELGGEFGREQVEEIVKRHTSSGSFIIIEYYDESTEILNITPRDKEAYLEWRLINANYYDIYLGNSPDNLQKYSSEPGTRTSITLKNLENDKNYYVQIVPIVGGISRLGSKILGFMPFNYSSSLPSMKYGEKEFGNGSYE